jgi:hypothetical protein
MVKFKIKTYVIINVHLETAAEAFWFICRFADIYTHMHDAKII